LIDKLSEEDCSPESLGIYISIYILSFWYDGILLQINVLVVENPRVNRNLNIEIVQCTVIWTTIRNLGTNIKYVLYI